MSRFESTIVVDVPVRLAYDQWTQFESFPQFMEGVQSVEQLDDKTLSWVATVGGIRKTWRAEITDQTPDTRIAWRSTEGAENAGAVLFEAIGDDRTRVTLRLDVEPEGPLESVGDALGVLKRQVNEDLGRFKQFIEGRMVATGAWRGEIHGDEVDAPREGQTADTPRR
jgi:uncharacterized membrane protein